jgi:sensor histidine kinase YesM
MYHGVVPKDGGEIGISIQPLEGGIMEICVSDNGIGMDAEALERINAALEAMQPLSRESGKRIALSNIYRRLKIVYGERASMRIESGPDTGTRITIRIPRNGKEKE